MPLFNFDIQQDKVCRLTLKLASESGAPFYKAVLSTARNPENLQVLPEVLHAAPFVNSFHHDMSCCTLMACTCGDAQCGGYDMLTVIKTEDHVIWLFNDILPYVADILKEYPLHDYTVPGTQYTRLALVFDLQSYEQAVRQVAEVLTNHKEVKLSTTLHPYQKLAFWYREVPRFQSEEQLQGVLTYKGNQLPFSMPWQEVLSVLIPQLGSLPETESFVENSTLAQIGEYVQNLSVESIKVLVQQYQAVLDNIYKSSVSDETAQDFVEWVLAPEISDHSSPEECAQYMQQLLKEMQEERGTLFRYLTV